MKRKPLESKKYGPDEKITGFLHYLIEKGGPEPLSMKNSLNCQ